MVVAAAQNFREHHAPGKMIPLDYAQFKFSPSLHVPKFITTGTRACCQYSQASVIGIFNGVVECKYG